MGKKTGIELQGFDEFYQKINTLNKGAEKVASQQFKKCLGILEQELTEKAQSAGLDSRLVNQIGTTTETTNVYFAGAVGWPAKQGSGNEPSDTEKVIYYNYGTPTRHTREEAQQVQLNGRWVTLGSSRGAIPAHGFVKKAKTAAKRKIKKELKTTLEKIINR